LNKKRKIKLKNIKLKLIKREQN